VFAAGDVTSGTAFVIEAVAAGHKVASSIDRYLRGEEMEPELKPELPVVRFTKDDIAERLARGTAQTAPRVRMRTLSQHDRIRTFEEVSLGFTDEEAAEEAARCLACGVCSECLSCFYKCGLHAIDHDMAERLEEVQVGSIILAPGYDVYDATQSEEFGFGRYPNVSIPCRLRGSSPLPGPPWATWSGRPTISLPARSPSSSAWGAATRITLIARASAACTPRSSRSLPGSTTAP